MSKYVINGAEVECSAGDSNTDLSVTNGAQVNFEGEAAANISDSSNPANVGYFGDCSLRPDSNGNPTPCNFHIGLPGDWSNSGSVNVNIGDDEALLEGATLQCTVSGTITINDPGQTTVKEG